MAMNTPYIGQSSVQTTDFSSDLSVFGTSIFSSDVQFLSTTSFVGAQAAGAITANGAIVGASTLSMVGGTSLAALTTATTGVFTSTLSVGGVITATAQVAVKNGLDLNTSQATFLSRYTTASLDSTTLADGELCVGSVSATSCVLNFRSGATTYTIIADAGSVL